ncbi:class I SAM-dependent methyltransferase [Candidatus Berkelbacteria bacterium]|nr:class I SAM-dependent methyltransferase [Candidatus Berkelbacteria bacterium]
MANQYQQADVVEVWDAVSQDYDPKSYSGVDNEANVETVKALYPDWSGRTVLEVGAGSGLSSLELARAGAQVSLLDLSPKALKFASQAFAKANLPVTLIEDDALALKHSLGAYDLVWNGGVIEHFVDEGKLALMKMMYRATKPGGVTFILVPNPLDLPYTIAKALLIITRRWVYGYEDDIHPARARRLVQIAQIPQAKVWSYNPVVGWWFLPLGKRLMNLFGRNTLKHHLARSLFGHLTVIEIWKPKH